MLVLCAEWLYRESSRLLQIEFPEPLSAYNRSLLIWTSERARAILINFPFSEVLNASKRFWSLSYSDPVILYLERDVRRRLHQHIRDANYHKLLSWITAFKELDLPRVSANTPTRHIMDSIKNIDNVYEAWIFLEFIEYLYEKGVLVDFRLGEKRYCEFVYKGKLVTFWYEKQFSEDGPHAWARTHTPDFTAMVGDTIVAIFDAKNYTESSTTEPINKMLAYMANLDSNFGALIFPNHPKHWDDFDREEKIRALSSVLSKESGGKQDLRLKKIAKTLARLPRDQLPDEYEERWQPKHMLVYSYPKPEKKARYHLNQKLCLFRMSPVSTETAIDLRNKSLESIFTEIISRLDSIS